MARKLAQIIFTIILVSRGALINNFTFSQFIYVLDFLSFDKATCYLISCINWLRQHLKYYYSLAQKAMTVARRPAYVVKISDA